MTPAVMSAPASSHSSHGVRSATLAVYGPTPDAELRLITCGGIFDPQLRSYLSNTVA